MKIKFMPQNVELDIDSTQSVMEVAHENDLPVKSVCHGMPQCAECRVKVVEGDHNVLPPSAKELSLIGTGYFLDGRRLACQLHCFGDVTIDLEEQVEKAQEQTHKRPQGAARKESAEESLAVTGDLIEQEHKWIEEADKEVGEVGGSEELSGMSFYSGLGLDGKEGGSKPKSKSNRRGRSRGRSGGARSKSGEKSGEASSSQSDRKASGEKSRRRRPNRKRSEGGTGEGKASADRPSRNKPSGDKGGTEGSGGAKKSSNNRNRNRRNRNRNKTPES